MNNESKSVPRQTIPPKPEDGSSASDESAGFKIGMLKKEMSVPT